MVQWNPVRNYGVTLGTATLLSRMRLPCNMFHSIRVEGAALGTLAVAVLVPGVLSGQQQRRAEFQHVADDPRLPPVLIIGDSISIGYALPFGSAQQGIADVHGPPANCVQTQLGPKKVDKWLGDGRRDLIHVSWKLHDLNYVDDAGCGALPPMGKQGRPPEEHEKRLGKLVRRRRQTRAILLWRPTTPDPRRASGRIKCSEVAARVVARHGIAVGDMNA